MTRPKPIFHSLYKGYEIYYRSGIKRRPWLVLIHPEPERETGKFASLTSLIACYNIIDKMINSRNRG